MKVCKHGHEYTKENTYFNARGTRRCKECNKLRTRVYLQQPEVKVSNRAKAKAWKEAHPEEYKALRAQAKAKYRTKFNALKPKCTRCEETHPACLDFHHRDPSTKKFSIGVHYGKHSWKAILEEVAKCDVLCSNCHRKLHAAERAALKEIV